VTGKRQATRRKRGRATSKRRSACIFDLRVGPASRRSCRTVGHAAMQMVGSVDFCLTSSPSCKPKGSDMRRQLRIRLLPVGYQGCLVRKAACVAVHSWYRSRAPAAAEVV
jgi:hypothetical protein